MRGRKDSQATMLAFVDLEARVAPDHPLRTIKGLADGPLAARPRNTIGECLGV